MACVHLLNCKIPVAMDRSGKTEIYYAQSSDIRNKETEKKERNYNVGN